jgi:hypothetical protein
MIRDEGAPACQIARERGLAPAAASDTVASTRERQQ